jgi:HEAT repeat protein
MATNGSTRGAGNRTDHRISRFFLSWLLSLVAVGAAFAGYLTWQSWQQKQALPALIRAIKTGNGHDRIHQFVRLVQKGNRTEEAIRLVIDTMRTDESIVLDRAERTLVAFGTGATIPLMEAVANEDEDLSVRAGATIALGQMKVEQAVPTLVAALKDANPRIRGATAGALETIGSRSTDPQPLIDALRDSEWGVRYWAARALGKIGPGAHEATPVLIELLGSQEWHDRAAAASALGETACDDASALAPLVDALDDEIWNVRSGAVWALGRMGTRAKSAIPVILPMLQDEHSTVRYNAAHAIRAIDSEAATKAGLAPSDSD